MRKKEQGILTIEASIVLTMMTLFVLFLFSFIRVYRAENMISHATLQAADAMALESYLRETALNGKAEELVNRANLITGSSSISAGSFESFRSANVSVVAKEKFVAAISDSETGANAILYNFGVKNGLSGVDFSASTVDLEHDDIILNVSYALKMQFPIFGVTEINVTKSAKAKTFGEILFEITAEPEDPNMGSTSGSGNYQHGSTVQITANPNYGYKFVRWNDGNTENPRIVPVTEAHKYIAVFEADSFGITTLVSPAGTGTATGEGTYTYLSTANLSASANPGYHFEKWSVYKHKDSTTAFVTDSNVLQTVDQSYTYTANFAPNTYTIKVVASGASGTVVVKSGANSGSSVTATYGSTFDLLQSAPIGYDFKGWKMEGGSSFISPTNGISVPATYPNGSLISNNATITYTAYYEISTFQVTVTSAGNGTATGGGTFTYNSTASIKATPNEGYLFDYWSLNGSRSNVASSYSFAVTNNVTYEAHFKQCTHGLAELVETYEPYCREIYSNGKLIAGASLPYRKYRCKSCGYTWKVEDESLRKHYRMNFKDGYTYDDFYTNCNTKHPDTHYGYCGSYSHGGGGYHTWDGHYHILCDYCHKEEQGYVWCYVDGELRYYNLHKCAKHGNKGTVQCPF